LTTTGNLTVAATGTANINGTLSAANASDSGALTVNGTLSAAGLNVDATGSVVGSGSLPPTTIAGTISAGMVGTAGQLTTGALTLAGTSTFVADLLGTNVGTDYDQVVVNGNVTLNGAALNVNSTIPANTPAGTQFVIIKNNSGNPINGTFTYQGNPLLEGASITVAGTTFLITYMGGGGGDFCLAMPPSNTAPVVTGFSVNTGASQAYMDQRSRLTNITVTFASDLTAPQFAAFSAVGGVTLTRNHVAAGSSLTVGTLVQTGAVGANGLIALTQPTSNTIQLTFSNADGSQQLPDRGVEYGSLGDGYWQLAIPSATYVSTDMDPSLRRLFGNSNNDSTVDGTDFGAFGNVFGTTFAIGTNGFDFNNDGTVDGTDFGEFGNRFGVTL
jgi:hypothetical protein